MDKKKLGFLILGIIIVLLPKLLICIAVGHLLELVKENPKLCSKKNTINPDRCTREDITNEITFIDKYNLKYDNSLKNDISTYKNMAIANIILAVISSVLLLIIQINAYKYGSKDIWQNNLHMVCFVLGTIFSIASFINLWICFGNYFIIFIDHKKYNMYTNLFRASYIIDFFFYLLGIGIASTLY